jgi:hypothetical protein
MEEGETPRRRSTSPICTTNGRVARRGSRRKSGYGWTASGLTPKGKRDPRWRTAPPAIVANLDQEHENRAPAKRRIRAVDRCGHEAEHDRPYR